ncbi:2Fe-2S iron-sulfur cluster-binding protein [Enhygromyxa salina]|uniref:Hydrogen cyanide synthase subunit HcnA n=1 Tax=Enhygromyxa salina TaxID=215803 RepID=A0A2S9YP12_9BACT|nr:2Fe-2S iron-sulfur cluster-binding protein [Enhygromyxa salina]PRQ06816.1 hypothetical protein ENSA7_34760 [Enhygromyxa salina]
MSKSTSPRVAIHVDGERVDVPPGASLAAVLLDLRLAGRGVNPSWAPICAMASCFGCLVRVDTHEQVRACTERCREGMRVDTHARPPS